MQVLDEWIEANPHAIRFKAGVEATLSYYVSHKQLIGEASRCIMTLYRQEIEERESDECKCGGIEIIRTHEGHVCAECGKLKD